jgi:hypothetical protein
MINIKLTSLLSARYVIFGKILNHGQSSFCKASSLCGPNIPSKVTQIFAILLNISIKELPVANNWQNLISKTVICVCLNRGMR